MHLARFGLLLLVVPQANVCHDSYVTMIFMQYGGLLSVRNRRVSILNSNPLWGPRKNLAVPMGMIGTALIGVVNLYGKGFQVGYTIFPKGYLG
jgi:sodium/potassium-transporting ATPase subunit alpha